MSYQKVEFMSRLKMMSHKGDSKGILISISSPGERPIKLKGEFKDILFLEFEAENFTRKEANKIYNFVDEYAHPTNQDIETGNVVDTIYVNCMLGECRSYSVATFLAGNYFLNVSFNPSVVDCSRNKISDHIVKVLLSEFMENED